MAMSKCQEFVYWKKGLSEEELERMLEITEDQAENSEIDGDSDAEDIIDNLDKLSTTTCSSAVSTPTALSPLPPFDLPSKSAVTTWSSPSSTGPALKRMRLLRTCQTENSMPSTSMDVEQDKCLDFDSDDSVVDKTYQPNDPQPLQLLLEQSNSDSGEEVEEQSEVSEFENWTKISVVPKRYVNFTFSEKMGPNILIDSDKPIDFFSVFFSAACITNIVNQSNLYATQCGTQLDLSVEELKAFVGVMIIMGFNSLPSLRKYWSRDQNFHNTRITSIFPIKRFLKILRNLHINDNTKMPQRDNPNYDKLYKIRPLIMQLGETFSNSFTSSRNVSIDESMVAFKGRTSLKQYMPMKPIKRGFKIWAMACAETGYLLAFDVYQGKSGEDSENTLGERVILKLSKHLQNKGFLLYFDNFFTTIPLMKKLEDKGLFGCGTIRQNRKFFPKSTLVEDKKLAMGQHDVAICGDISVAKWKDRGKKSVTVCSNMHNLAQTGTVLRTNKFGHREEVRSPISIVDYNKYMGGVDRFDQRMAAYSIAWKSRKWWLKLFYYLTNACIVNAYILYSQTKKGDRKKKAITHLEFRSILANQLTESFCARKKAGPAALVLPTEFENVCHLPGKTTSRRCAQCSKHGIQKRTSLEFTKCRVSLCLECFAVYHQGN